MPLNNSRVGDPRSPKASIARHHKRFWSSIPGIVTVIGGIITGVGTAITLLFQLNVLGPDELKGIKVSGPSQSIEYVGQCPTRIRYQGSISVDEGKGTVKYELIVGDYREAGRKQFDGRGTRLVEHTFLVAGSFRGFVKLATIEPESEFADTPINVSCQAA